MNLVVQIEINQSGQVRIGSSEQIAPELMLNILLDSAKLIAQQLVPAKPRSDLLVPDFSIRP